MGEETRNARTTVPKACFWTMAGSVFLGFVMMITLMVFENPLLGLMPFLPGVFPTDSRVVLLAEP